MPTGKKCQRTKYSQKKFLWKYFFSEKCLQEKNALRKKCFTEKMPFGKNVYRENIFRKKCLLKTPSTNDVFERKCHQEKIAKNINFAINLFFINTYFERYNFRKAIFSMDLFLNTFFPKDIFSVGLFSGSILSSGIFSGSILVWNRN